VRRRFFVEHFNSDSATLHGDAAEHLGRVLRAERGQLYELSDGQCVWLGRVERVALSKRGGSRIEFALVEPILAREPLLRITLLLALVKFDRFEWCIEKATELGATKIVPVAAARSDKVLIAAAPKRLERWNRILLESAGQCRRLRAPLLVAAIDDSSSRAHPSRLVAATQAFQKASENCKIVLSERREAHSLREILLSAKAGAEVPRPGSSALAIGPEGGWTGDELAAARTAGFAEASLGENILRTETAVLASMAILQFALGKQ
jgi:16S rRNA (uracil1498-N3)-methyltransferase